MEDLNEKNIIENKKENESNNNSFYKLYKIQKLLEKESALNELCKS
jgi:hypothetical protein